MYGCTYQNELGPQNVSSLVCEFGGLISWHLSRGGFCFRLC